MAKAPLNIIKYDDGRNDVLVYKSEITDFNAESLLIVDQSQQALLYKDGQAEGPFLSGRYNLPTNNILTFRQKFARLFSRRKDGKTDGSTPFTCEVYFVNMVNDIPVQWGTPDRFPVKDPIYSEIVRVGAHGSVKIKVSDPMRFVVSMVGQMGEYSLERLQFSVRSDIMNVLKTYLSAAVVQQNTSLLEIQGRLMELSQDVERKLNEKIEDYGIEALHFNIEDISVDEASMARLLEAQKVFNIERNARIQTNADVDRTRRMSEAQLMADYNRTVMMGEAQAKAREAQGYTYNEEQSWKTQQAMASNPGMFRPVMPFPGMPYPGMMYPGGMPYPGMPYPGQPGQPIAGGMSICPNCRNQVPANSAFCGFCGFSLSPQQPPQAQGQPAQGQQAQKTHTYAQQSKTCPKCGYPLLPRTTVCPNCDYDLSSEEDK